MWEKDFRSKPNSASEENASVWICNAILITEENKMILCILHMQNENINHITITASKEFFIILNNKVRDKTCYCLLTAVSYIFSSLDYDNVLHESTPESMSGILNFGVGRSLFIYIYIVSIIKSGKLFRAKPSHFLYFWVLN